MRELVRAAQARGVRMMSPASLRVALSRWENDHVQPAAEHRHLLRAVLGVELDGDERNEGHDTVGPVLTLAQVDSQAEILEAIRRSDRLGCALITNPQLNTYSMGLRASLRTGAPLEVRLRLASLIADSDALIGWQLLDLGHADAAIVRYESAERSAAVADENDTLIWPHRDGLIWPRPRHSGAVVTV